MHLYVAGPMATYPEHNFPAFHLAARHLRAAGYEVTNPAEVSLLCGCEAGTHTWSEYLQRDLATMLSSGVRGLALLDGWQDSKGAKLEAHVAVNLGWPVEPVSFWLDRPDLRLAEFYEVPSSCAGVRS